MAGGLLLAAAFPKFSLAGLAWVAPGVMLAAGLGSSRGEAFRLGYVAGLIHFLVALYWLLFMPFPAGAAVGWLALSAYVALYPAAWVCGGCALVQPWLERDLAPGAGPAWLRLARRLASLNLVEGWVWALGCAALWVALEMIRGRFLSGFPWNFLGASQYQLLPVIQLAAVTGVYGVSFLVVWFSVSLLLAVARILSRPELRMGWATELFLPLVVLAVVSGFGLHQIFQRPATTRELKVALAQPSIPQTLIWDPRENATRFRGLMELSRMALSGKPDLLVWPEAALPSFDEESYEAMTNMISSNRVWMVFGADDAQTRGDKTNYFNGAFLFRPDGKYAGVYHKRRLVIFGEYVPLADWLPFLKYLTPIDGGFTPGDRPARFELSEPRAKFSVLICFEDVFPHLAPTCVEDDTDFLLNLTNDGWFGQSAAQWQQAAGAVFRAVENGLPLVRCTNNGLTCWIDANGGLHEVYFGDSTDIYGAGFKAARIPLLTPGQKRTPTFYHDHPDLFGWCCVGLSAALMGWRFRDVVARGTGFRPNRAD